eukprot:scaffold474_cov365-Prasinococcus_capsulatus_cf.AAC.2
MTYIDSNLYHIRYGMIPDIQRRGLHRNGIPESETGSSRAHQGSDLRTHGPAFHGRIWLLVREGNTNAAVRRQGYRCIARAQAATNVTWLAPAGRAGKGGDCLQETVCPRQSVPKTVQRKPRQLALFLATLVEEPLGLSQSGRGLLAPWRTR